MTLNRQSFLITPEEVEDIKNETLGKVCNNKCLGRGAFLENAQFVDCTCKSEFERRVRLRQANIPKKYWDFDLRNLNKEYAEKNDTALQILKKYTAKLKSMADKGIGLYIQGTHGLAKTALSYYILKEGIKKDIVCYATSMSQLTDLLYCINNPECKSRIDWIKKEVQLLVIEEIEKDYNVDKSTSFMGSLVNDFFRSLYDTKKALIVTSNLSKKALKESKIHADNVADRFEELVDIILVGSSYRKQDESLKQILGA